jgi:exopolysaccharide production protein ExoY
MEALRQRAGEPDTTASTESAGAGALTLVPTTGRTFYQRRGKRLLDVVLGTLLLVALLPLMVVAALAVLATSGWPILYRAERSGLHGRPIPLLKFRTMKRGADKQLHLVLTSSQTQRREFQRQRKLSEDPRTTKIGKLLRVASVDELPQLFNVILGQMSLIGPRPVPRDELEEKYGSRGDYLLSVRPGISGLWQVSGRSRTTYDERIRYDLRYAGDVNLRQDLRILTKTVVAVLNFGEAA